MIKSTNKNSYRNNGMMSPSILLLFGWGILVVAYGYIFSYAARTGEGDIPYMILPMVLGVLIENWRLSSDWQSIQVKLLISLLISLVVFLPGKTETTYIFAHHITYWPYFFIVTFVIASVLHHNDRSILQLGEGITLLQTMSLIYLIIEREWYHLAGIRHWLALILIGVMTCYVLIHAFTTWNLSKLHRLILSLWSSIIMLVFAGDHLSRVTSFKVSKSILEASNFLKALEFFLLGVALIYIFRNVMMLFVYLPSKTRFYQATHRAEIKKAKGQHIARYGRTQLPFNDALLLLTGATFLFAINYYLNFFPDHTLIWLLFWIIPIMLLLKNDKIVKLKK